MAIQTGDCFQGENSNHLHHGGSFVLIMQVRSPLPKKHARIEIIPLIDIMFFLLASFMMVSLSQTHMKGIKVALPAKGAAQQNPNVHDSVSIRVSPGNTVYFDNVPVPDDQVLPRLYQLHDANPNIKVSISAEMMSIHGDVIALLDKVRLAKIEKVGYQIRAAPGTSQ
jgi:biopolymer transport protein ExbD